MGAPDPSLSSQQASGRWSFDLSGMGVVKKGPGCCGRGKQSTPSSPGARTRRFCVMLNFSDGEFNEH